jgi:hypothetical protein
LRLEVYGLRFAIHVCVGRVWKLLVTLAFGTVALRCVRAVRVRSRYRARCLHLECSIWMRAASFEDESSARCHRPLGAV